MSQTKRLTDFLLRLSTDARQLEQFEVDPTKAMVAAGLSAGEQQAVLSRNPDAIRLQLGQTHVSHMTDDKTAKKKAAKKK